MLIGFTGAVKSTLQTVFEVILNVIILSSYSKHERISYFFQEILRSMELFKKICLSPIFIFFAKILLSFGIGPGLFIPDSD